MFPNCIVQLGCGKKLTLFDTDPCSDYINLVIVPSVARDL